MLVFYPLLLILDIAVQRLVVLYLDLPVLFDIVLLELLLQLLKIQIVLAVA